MKQVPAGSATLEFDGIEIDLSGVTASAGDSFSFNPMAGAAEGIGRAINSAQDFAAADASGAGWEIILIWKRCLRSRMRN